ncbi:DUF2225 domain-containing protein [Alkaliphilus pronyensis]|uniref:DUF2225 domain-containing protein n=1 Tax=Alkaliphilus pronyensis TaxID=1482732 RepID=A0A6I0FBF9_9FIRM|nr:DUF2225 domain-containing protein [Alkaliphilus pronyensis]KAB3534830.1 DUF2225 domain-containing protein [Alkaliphilus pronyensis]
MDTLLYDKTVCCVSCKHIFTTKMVKSRRLKILEKQDDYNIIYKDINPSYYLVWVCPECGYSGTESEYIELSKPQKDIVFKHVRTRWLKRDFGKVRSASEAIEAFKLALVLAQLLKKSKAYAGSLCLRLAWIYREQNNPTETEYLKYALKFFLESYSQEKLPAGGLDEVTMAYLIGELSRRFGGYKEAIHWYNKALDNPEIKKKRQLQLKIREQWRRAKEEYDTTKKHIQSQPI